MKQLIDFDETNYTKEMNKLNRLVNGINEAMPILTEFETVTLDMLRNLATRTEIDYIDNERRKENLKKFAKKYGVQYNSLTSLNHAHIFSMARGATSYLKDAKKLIGHAQSYFFRDNLIILDENIVKVAPNAEEILREGNSLYTVNKVENKLLEKLNGITDTINEISAEFGLFNVEHLFYYNIKESKYKMHKHAITMITNQKR